MAEAASAGVGRADVENTDDDALADAILATFTSSIPVARLSAALPSEAELIAVATGPILLKSAPEADRSEAVAAMPAVEASSDVAPGAAAERLAAPAPAPEIRGLALEADSTFDPGRPPELAALLAGLPAPEPPSDEREFDGRPTMSWPLARTSGPAAELIDETASQAGDEPFGAQPPRGAHRAVPHSWQEAPAPSVAVPSLVEPPEHVAVVAPSTAPTAIQAQRRTAPAHAAPEPEPTDSADASVIETVIEPPPGPVLPPVQQAGRLRLPGATEVERVGVEPAPRDRRAGRALRLFWLWFAANAGVLSLGVGGVLVAEGLSLRQAIVAAIGGLALSALPLSVGAVAGKWSGQPTLVVSRASFGHLGNILPAIAALLSRVLWSGLLVWIAADGIRVGLRSAGFDGGLADGAVTGLSYGVVVLLAAVVAIIGYGLVSRVQGVLSALSALLVVGLIVSTAGRIDLGEALRRQDGSWVLVVGGAVVVFSFVGLAWVHSSSDVARYQHRSGSGGATALWSGLGATVPALVLLVWGALLAASSSGFAARLASSPVAAIASIAPSWFPVPLLVLVAASALAGTVISVYSGGFSLLAAGLKSSRWAATTLAAALAALAGAVFCFDGGTDWTFARELLVTAAVPIAAWTGVFLADMTVRRGGFDTASLLARGGHYPDVRLGGFLGFIAATVLGYGFIAGTAPMLGWEGFGWRALGLASGSPLWSTQLGVLLALLIGLLVSIFGAVRARGVDRSEPGSVIDS